MNGHAVDMEAVRSATRLSEFETTAVVESKTIVAEGVVELILRRADGKSWPRWTAGSHIDLLLPSGIVRQYSLCGTKGNPMRWRIGVLKEPASRGGSQWVHENLNAGHEIRVRGPRNHFKLDSHDSYLFIAGGIGITPIIAMVWEAQRTGKRWKLYYGGRTRSSMAFIDELRSIDGDVSIIPQDEAGLLPLADIIGTPVEGVGIFACGPGPMLDAVETYRDAWAPGSMHTERFVATDDSDRSQDEAIEVHLAASDLTIIVAADESILSAVENVGIGVLSSCRVGTCGTCETSVLEGEPDHRDTVLDEDDRERNGCIMICVSRALSKRLVLDL